MRNLPDELETHFFFSEPPLEHFAEKFYLEAEDHTSFLLWEGWWDNSINAWVLSGHNQPIEILENNLPDGCQVLLSDGDKKMHIVRSKHKHLPEFDLELFRYTMEDEIEDD